MVFQTFERVESKPRRDDRVMLACGFAFTTGWTDVLCTLRFGAFGTMCTGNAIYLAKSVSNGSVYEFLFYTSAILCYCLGVFVHRHLDKKLEEATSALVMSIPVATCCLAVDALGVLFGHNRYYVCFISLACGIVNVVSQRVAGAVTNAVTGNLQKLTLALWEHLCSDDPLDEPSRRSALVTLLVVASFLTGIGLSAVSLNLLSEESYLHEHLNFVPVAVAFTLLLWRHDHCYAEELEARIQKAAHLGGSCRPSCITTSPDLPRLVPPRAQAAPTHPRAPPQQLGGLPWPQ